VKRSWTDVGRMPAAGEESGAVARRARPMLVAALFMAGLSACHDRKAADNVLRVGSQRGGTKSLMLAAHALDGAPYRVEWSEFPASQNLLEALGAGAIDVGLVGDQPFQFAYQAGSPIRAVGAQAVRPAQHETLAIMVPGPSPIRSVEALKGKRVATTRGSAAQYLLLRALAARGLKASDVTQVYLSPGDAKAAFDSGAVDAWTTWIPYTGLALKSGARILVDGADYVNFLAFEAANVTAATEKQAILADFLDREARALLWAHGNPGPAASVLAKETGLPLDIARFTVDHGQRIAVPIDDRLKADEREVVSTFKAAGEIAGDRPSEDAYLPLWRGDASPSSKK